MDLADVDRLCVEIQHQTADLTFDVDRDGYLGTGDVDAVLESLGSRRGDLDLDGDADAVDMAMAWVANPSLRRVESPLEDGGHLSAGAYSQGNFNCRYEGVRPLRESMFGVDRGTSAEMFIQMQGDYNVDGVFNSTDLVQLFSTGEHVDVETGELVVLFQRGHYQ